MQEAKQRRVVFVSDTEMPSADTAPYIQWKNWRDGPSSSAVAFVSPEDRGAMVAAHHARLLLEGLDLQDVDLLTRWAGPDMEPYVVLLLLAMFECVSGLVLDVTSGEWVRQGTDAFASASSSDPQYVGEADLQDQIDECERRLQELRGPRVPAFSHEAMTRLAGTPLPWVWQRDAVHTLQRFVKTGTSKAARAGWTLAEDVWRFLYRLADSPTPVTAGRQQVPATTKPLRPGPAWSMLSLWLVWPLGTCLRLGRTDLWTSPVPSPDKPNGGVNATHAGLYAAFATDAYERTGAREERRLHAGWCPDLVYYFLDGQDLRCFRPSPISMQ